MKPIGAAQRPPRCVSGPLFARAGIDPKRDARLPAVADDLTTPLGQTPKRTSRFALAAWLPRATAGLLGLCFLVFAGWVVVADDPLGGEPMVIVSADARAPNKNAPAAKPGELAGDATKGSPASGAPGSAQTITIIDGMSGKRQEVTIAAADS